jgi:hypothetical protein
VPEIWIAVSDVIIPTRKLFPEVLKLVNETWTIPLKIWIQTTVVHIHIPFLLSIHSPFILISYSNDDHCFPFHHWPCDPPIYTLGLNLLASPYLIAAYAKNPCFSHPKLHPIPLGSKVQWVTPTFFGEDKTPTLVKFSSVFSPTSKFYQSIHRKYTISFCMDRGHTSDPFYRPHANIREVLYQHLIVFNFSLSPCSGYFDNYFDIMEQSRFTLAPPGGGIDTHRFYEALAVGSIPIVINTTGMSEIYEDLPVLIINAANEITSELLDRVEKDLRNSSRKYKWEKLLAPYWLERIENVV